MGYNARDMPNQMMQPVSGMRDVLPAAAAGWRHFEEAARRCFHLYGYGEIRTPLVENLDLFRRPLGEDTDIVQKEMYTFTDALSGKTLALRPEATVSTVRALLAANSARGAIARVWYGGPMFRHERPQKGRHRQFHQIGAEALGSASPFIEAEQIALLHRLWQDIGIADQLRLEVNNLGSAAERAAHRDKLIAYFQPRAADWDDTLKRRLRDNPWRLLDDKSPRLRPLIADAPPLSAALSAESRRHTDTVKNQLAKNNIAFAESPHLVRGLDYYNLTVYEWSLAADDRRQNTICGGGRYDGLAEKIGGSAVPGCGFALGVERVLDIMRAPPAAAPDCIMAVVDDSADCRAYAERLAEQCRAADIAVLVGRGGDKLGRQMARAEQMRARAVIAIGEREYREGVATLKPIGDAARAPRAIAADDRFIPNLKAFITHV